MIFSVWFVVVLNLQTFVVLYITNFEAKWKRTRKTANKSNSWLIRKLFNPITKDIVFKDKSKPSRLSNSE